MSGIKACIRVHIESNLWLYFLFIYGFVNFDVFHLQMHHCLWICRHSCFLASFNRLSWLHNKWLDLHLKISAMTHGLCNERVMW